MGSNTTITQTGKKNPPVLEITFTIFCSLCMVAETISSFEEGAKEKKMMRCR
jgi:hypothetical protein